jgi:hypothetical protein
VIPPDAAKPRYEFKPFEYGSHYWILNALGREKEPVKIFVGIPAPLPVQIVLPPTGSALFAPLHEAHYALTRCWKSVFAYQFVITAAPCAPLRPEVSFKQAAQEWEPVSK